MIITESDRVIKGGSAEGLIVTVEPFQEGSFIMDLLLRAKQDGGMLFAALVQSDALKDIEATLKIVGLIRDAKGKASSLLDIVRKMAGKKPAKVKEKKSGFEYETEDGTRVSVPAAVHNLYNNGVINNYFYSALAAPLESSAAKSVETYSKSDKDRTLVSVSPEDADALRSYSTPVEAAPKIETIENIVTQVLRPKSGNYGDHLGLWTFTVAGTTQTLKAKISDEKFLGGYTRGEIRFYQGDLLKVTLREKQIITGVDIYFENEILKVLDYTPASLGTSPPLKSSKPKPTSRKRSKVA